MTGGVDHEAERADRSIVYIVAVLLCAEAVLLLLAFMIP